MFAALAVRPFNRAGFVVLVVTLTFASLLLGAPRAAADGPATSQPDLSAPAQRIENVISAASQYLGFPYRVGTQGPATFDCSGLVFRAFSDAGLVDRVGGARLRAAGYMRWFAARGLMTRDEAQAQRGDLVVYNGGSHIGLYLGDGRVLSALVSGVTVHSLHGVQLPVTGFLRPDWSGAGDVAPFAPETLPEVPEQPAALAAPAAWMPSLDPTTTRPIAREGTERIDMRTTTSRTFENRDGTFTTEFHSRPIFYLPEGSTRLRPIDLRFAAGRDGRSAAVDQSPVALVARPADDRGRSADRGRRGAVGEPVRRRLDGRHDSGAADQPGRSRG